MLIEHMTEGFSFESFGATIDVGVATLYRWVDIYPEFANAKNVGNGKSLRLFESLLVSKLNGKNYNDRVLDKKVDVKKIDASLARWFLTMRHKSIYTDSQTVKIEGGDKPIEINSNVNINNLSLDDLKKLKEIQEKLNATTNTKAD